MEKETWGINVIGNQGTNALNDVSIRPSDDGKDVIFKIHDAELSGEEFTKLKDIADHGGGGTPDPGDATNGDFLGVKVTPAVVRFVPAMKVGDHLEDICGYVPAIPDFDALTYDSSIESMPASKICGFTLTITAGGQTESVSGDLLAFKLSEGNRSICGISPVQSGGHFGETFMYLTGLKDEMGFEGWYPEAVSGNFCSLADIMGLHGVDSYDIVITSLGQTSQDIWGQFIGGSKTVEEISPEVKEVVWEKPYPAIKKVGQALVTVGEEYNLYPGLRVDEDGQFYFNIDDVASVESTINLFGDNLQSGFVITILNNDNQPTLMLGMTKLQASDISLDHDVNVMLVINMNDQVYDIVYSTEEFDWENPMTHEQQHILHGWNEGLNHCEWDNGYQISMSDGNTLTPEQAKQYVQYYGSVITVQEDLFYGDVKNADAQWQDIMTEVNPDDYDTTSVSNTNYLMVEDNNGDLARVSYSSMKSTIEDEVKQAVAPTNGTISVSSGIWVQDNDHYIAEVSLSFDLGVDDTLMVSPYDLNNAALIQDANVYYANEDAYNDTIYFYCKNLPSSSLTFKYTLIRG